MSDDSASDSDLPVSRHTSQLVAAKLMNNLTSIQDAQQAYFNTNTARLDSLKRMRTEARCAGSFFPRRSRTASAAVKSSALFATDKSDGSERVRRWLINVHNEIAPLSIDTPAVVVMKDDMRAAILYLAFLPLSTDDFLAIVDAVKLPSDMSLSYSHDALVQIAKSMLQPAARSDALRKDTTAPIQNDPVVCTIGPVPSAQPANAAPEPTSNAANEPRTVETSGAVTTKPDDDSLSRLLTASVDSKRKPSFSVMTSAKSGV